eukprot:CAMPEP_0173146198 /NCGR_PEP_ID=MMETSP1105-20130129/8344_1 /TAXON_ID=2985 /ORGANISM="Ochromonas sp., Strain BG-1" /LENGTH=199 /DNA_ID=CAMNT_0014060341 /DNA_START=159 /DNA_END=755 /DNA_ORIENTATION=+
MEGLPHTSIEKLIQRIEISSEHGYQFSLYSGSSRKDISIQSNDQKERRKKIEEIVKDIKHCQLSSFEDSMIAKLVLKIEDETLLQQTIDALTKFSELEESAAQGHDLVLKMYQNLGFFDSHSSPVTYREATIVRSPGKTVKPDGIHSSLPILLDFKGQNADSVEALEQILERGTTMGEIQGFLSNIIGFGSGKNSKSFW